MVKSEILKPIYRVMEFKVNYQQNTIAFKVLLNEQKNIFESPFPPSQYAFCLMKNMWKKIAF